MPLYIIIILTFYYKFFFPPLFLSCITPDSHNHSVFGKPIPIKDQPLCSHSSVFHSSSPSSCNHEAQTISLPTQLFLYISWLWQVPFPLSLFMSFHKLHTIMILWIYLSISNSSSIVAPLFYATEHSLEAQLSKKKLFRKKFKHILYLEKTCSSWERPWLQILVVRKKNKQRKSKISIWRPNGCTFPLCNKHVFLSLGLRYGEVFLPLHLNKKLMA